MATISRKICLVGDFGVGKTSLIRRFVDQQFSDEYLSTVGVKISRKTIEIPTQALQLLIWDIEGSTKFKAIAPTYLQGAKGAVIVADLTRQETLDHLLEHIDLFLKTNPQGWLVVGLNKADLVECTYAEHVLKQISEIDRQALLSTYLTSAKTGHNVGAMFQTLSEKLID